MGTKDDVNREEIERVVSAAAKEAGFRFHSIEGDDHRLMSLRGSALVSKLVELAEEP